MKVLKKLGSAVFVALTASTTAISNVNVASARPFCTASNQSLSYSDMNEKNTSLLPTYQLLPEDYGCGGDYDPGYGGGGGGYGGGTPVVPVVPQYRLLPSLKFEDSWYSYLGSGTTGSVVEAVAYFEQNVGGVWQRVDAQNLNIDCYVNGSFRDHDGENNASKLDVEFDYEGGSVSCNYSANNGAYTSTLTLP